MNVLTLTSDASGFLEGYFFCGTRISAADTDFMIQDGRISRVNLLEVESFDLMPDGSVLAWTKDGNGYEVRTKWIIEKIRTLTALEMER